MRLDHLLSMETMGKETTPEFQVDNPGRDWAKGIGESKKCGLCSFEGAIPKREEPYRTLTTA